MSDVGQNLEAMNAVQYVLAFVFLASYALALGEFIGARGRWIAIATASASAVAFCALSMRWEQGLMLVVIALAGMGLFVALSWTMWTVANWQERRLARIPVPAAEPNAHLAVSRGARARRRLGMRST